MSDLVELSKVFKPWAPKFMPTGLQREVSANARALRKKPKGGVPTTAERVQGQQLLWEREALTGARGRGRPPGPDGRSAAQRYQAEKARLLGPRPSGPVGKSWNPFKAVKMVDEVSSAAARPRVGSLRTAKGKSAKAVRAGSVGPVVDTRAGVRRAASMVPGVTPEAKQAASAQRARQASAVLHEGFGDEGAAGVAGDVVRRRRNALVGLGAGGVAAAGGVGAASLSRRDGRPVRSRGDKQPVGKALLPAKAVSTLRSVKGRLMASKPAKNFLSTQAGQNARSTYQAARSGFQNAPAGFGQQMRAATKQGWSAATPNQKFAAAGVMGTGTLGAGYGMGRMHKSQSSQRDAAAAGGLLVSSGGLGYGSRRAWKKGTSERSLANTFAEQERATWRSGKKPHEIRAAGTLRSARKADRKAVYLGAGAVLAGGVGAHRARRAVRERKGDVSKLDERNDRMVDNALGVIGVGTGAGLARAARQRKAKAAGQLAASGQSYAEAEALRSRGRSLRRSSLMHRANAAEARGKKLKLLSGGSARSAKFTRVGALGAAGAGGAMLYQANRPDIERGARSVKRRVASRVAAVRQG